LQFVNGFRKSEKKAKNDEEMKWGKKSRWKYRHGVEKKNPDPSSGVKIPSADTLSWEKW